jgi:hypothetical protein
MSNPKKENGGIITAEETAKKALRAELKHVNRSFEVYKQRANGETKLPISPYRIFAAGFFVDENGDANLVKDDQDGTGKKVWHKMPGGNSEKCAKKQDFLIALAEQLKKAGYSNAMISQIMAKEEAADRTIAEMTFIFEMVEETLFYPIQFSFGVDGFRYNSQTGEYDIWQIYFLVSAVISPHSSELEKPIRHIRQVKTAKAGDGDVKDMRVIVPVEELIDKLGPKTHKIAGKILLEKKANWFYGKSIDPNVSRVSQEKFAKLSRRFAEAAVAAPSPYYTT